MGKNRLFSLMVIALTMVILVGSSAGWAQPQSTAKVNWKMAVYPTSLEELSAKSYVAMAKAVSTRTNGAFKIDIFPSGALGYNNADYQKVTGQGLIQMSEAMAGGVQGAPGFLVTAYDGMYKTSQDSEKAWQAVEPDLQKIAATFNARILSHMCRGLSNAHSTKRAFPTVQSFKGSKWRAWNPINAAMITALGGVPQAIPYAERYTSLATGIVEGNWAASSTQVDTKDYEVCKFTNIWPGNEVLMVGFVNLKAYNDLPQQYQAILSEEMKKAGVDGMAKYMNLDQEARKTLASKGVTIVQPTAEEINKFMVLSKTVHEKFNTTYGQQANDIYKQIKSTLGY